MRLSVAWFLFAFILYLSGCTYDDEELYYTTCDTLNVTYSQTVMPLLNDRCISCHSNANPSGNVRLEEYDDVIIYVNSGQLSGSINHKQGFSPMPQNQPKLDDCTLRQIEKWIREGAKND